MDGGRLELPVDIRGESVRLRYRAARFVNRGADVSLHAGGVIAETWRQRPSGWRLRENELGPVRGPLSLQWRVDGDPDGLAVAIDWLEIGGARALVPSKGVLVRLAALCLLVPLLLARGDPRHALRWALGLGVLAAAAIVVDRLGSLIALSDAALPLVAGAAGLALFARDREAWVVPATAAAVALVALAHPGFYYPDVDTHARYLQEARRDPGLWLDPTPYQLRTGAWTRELGGRRVGFPYSPAFHVLAVPLAVLLGEVLAIKVLAVACWAATLRLTTALARMVLLPPRAALAAAALVALFPVSASRLTLALYPALLGQALEIAALLLLGAPGRLDTRSGRVRLLGFWVLALAAYTGSLITLNVVVLLVALLWVRHTPPRAAVLLGLHGLAVVMVVAALYARFLPVLLGEVVPNAGGSAAIAVSPWAPLARLHLFYDTVPLLLAAIGVGALWRLDPDRRAPVAAALGAGLLMLVLRSVVPALFRDAKEVELLAAPLAVCAVAGAEVLAARGRAGTLAATVAMGTIGAWGAWRAAAVYTDRFLAVAR